jgi:hypothetical protein
MTFERCRVVWGYEAPAAPAELAELRAALLARRPEL